MGFPGASDGKESPAVWETWVDIQYFVSFRYTAKKDYTHTHILFQILFHYRFFLSFYWSIIALHVVLVSAIQ